MRRSGQEGKGGVPDGCHRKHHIVPWVRGDGVLRAKLEGEDVVKPVFFFLM